MTGRDLTTIFSRRLHLRATESEQPFGLWGDWTEPLKPQAVWISLELKNQMA
jgi:hypothetical protein